MLPRLFTNFIRLALNLALDKGLSGKRAAIPSGPSSDGFDFLDLPQLTNMQVVRNRVKIANRLRRANFFMPQR